MILRLALVVGLAVALDGIAAAREQDKVDAHGEKLICRREAPIGSLIATRKRCYTKAEWDNISVAARANTQQMTENGQSRPSGQ